MNGWNQSRRESGTRHQSEVHKPEYPSPMNTLDKLRAESLALSGGRTPGIFPTTPGLQGRAKDFAREDYIRAKTNLKRPEAIVPVKTGARDAAGPPINVNQTQLTSDDKGQVNTSEWMHSWWGHACGCGEET